MSNGIVVESDRSRAHRRARRHSIAVRALKLGLPLVSLGTIALYGAAVMKTIGWGAGIAQLELPQILPENLTMENPHYEGFTKDGGQYWVKARTAQQDLKNFNLIKLQGITGEVTSAQKQKTLLTAARGVFESKANQLELYDAIDISGEDGMTAKLSHASIDTKENIITSGQPVTVTMAAGTITSNEMKVRQKTKEYTFTDEVKTRLQPKTQAAPTETAAVRTQQPAFANSDAPVDIESNRLDINDTTKIAIFTGNVRAVQDQDVLTTPELEVNYEGGPAPGGAAADAGGGNKVKRIVAKAPVTLQQGSGQTVTSQIADFDAVNKRAVLDGGVVMTELPDKRATSDRADLDQLQNTVLLTGNVVVTQGTNELKGRRLYFDRNSNKMQLTSPGASGTAGRIAARFAQAGTARPSKPETSEPKPDTQGFSLNASFRTDPNAPVSVDADRLDVDDRIKQAVFIGAVHAIQGDFQMRAAEMTANYSGSAGLAQAAEASKGGAAKLSRIRARKNVEITGTDGSATGDWADFDVVANRATLGGNVVLKRGKSVLNGTRLLMDLTTGESTLVSQPGSAEGGGTATSSSDGSGQGIVTGAGRPHATFFPNELKSQNKKQPATENGGWQVRPSR